MQSELKEKIEQRENTYNRVTELLISYLALGISSEQLDPDTPLFGVGLEFDSIDAIEIIISLESEFGIVLDDGESASFLRTINSLVDEVMRRKEVGLDERN